MNYYNEIKTIIEEREINKKVRELKDNREDLLTRWNIGKLLVDAQGGEKRAKYGSSLIKKWGCKFEKEYGSNYNSRNLFNYKRFYLAFPIVNAVRSQLNWTHYRKIISLKDENERNYYVNQVIINNLSSRELEREIKNKAFNRLSYANKNNIKLIEDSNYSLTIEDMIKDPILIKVDKNIDKMDEKMLHKYIIDMLEDRFLELGNGFNLTGHEYKIIIDNRTYKIDLLFFNTELNRYVVIELKVRELKVGDKEQVKFYTNYVDKNLKKDYMNKSVGILIVKKNNKFVLEYSTDGVFITTYKMINK